MSLLKIMDLLKSSLLLFGLIGFAVSSCSDGWIRHGSTCYHFSHDKEEWSSAFQICQILGGSLLQIEDAAESSYITGQIKSHSNYRPWIALTDLAEENVYVWMVSKAKLDSTSYANWASNQPDNAGGLENCVHLYDEGTWNDSKCDQSFYYICEKQDESGAEIVG